jgi:hypothetical protein
MTGRRTHRSHVSYIDKSRQYYAAHGYNQAYRWATHEDVPFATMAKPLAESRVGLVTTVFFPRGAEPNGVSPMPPKAPFAAPVEAAPNCTFNADLAWAKDETHTNDLDTYLPINRLTEAAANGRVGSIAPRFYGVPTDYSQRRTHADAADIAAWMTEDGVDVALLVPL